VKVRPGVGPCRTMHSDIGISEDAFGTVFLTGCKRKESFPSILPLKMGELECVEEVKPGHIYIIDLPKRPFSACWDTMTAGSC